VTISPNLIPDGEPKDQKTNGIILAYNGHSEVMRKGIADQPQSEYQLTDVIFPTLTKTPGMIIA
jgi:hypothetical protein